MMSRREFIVRFHGTGLVEAWLVLAALAFCGFELISSTHAQTPSRRASSSAVAGTYRIAGVLVNAATGDPVRRATVEALNIESNHAVASCVTDSEGRFALERLGAAKYQLTASKRGFRTSSYDEHDEFSSSVVTGPGQDTTQLQFKLTPGAVLRGSVTSDEGEPVGHARVMLFKRPKHAGTGERITQGETALTDDVGAYEFGDLEAGEYLMAVAAEPWYAIQTAKQNPALDVAFPVTYFDSTTEEQSATPIVIAGGSHEEANIALHSVPALHLSVAAPRKADNTLVQPELQQTIFGNVIATENSTGIVDALQAGSVEMGGIAPGHYELTHGEPPRVIELDLSSNQQVDANAGIAANSIAGRVRTASGAAVPQTLNVTLERADGSSGVNQYVAEAHYGQFKFDAVPAGEWAVWATSGDKALPVVTVGAGGTQRDGNLITLRERSQPLLVTVSSADSEVKGFARKDGKGFAGAMMVLLPRNTAHWKALTRRDQSNTDGSFSFRDVAPGEYTLLAIKDGWSLDWTSPPAMARYLLHGTSVTVTEQSGTQVQLSAPVIVQDR